MRPAWPICRPRPAARCSVSRSRSPRRCDKSGVRCEGVNLFVADGEAAGQDVFHVHLHVIPRYAGDGFGFRFGPAYGTRPPREELDRLAEQIRHGL